MTRSCAVLNFFFTRSALSLYMSAVAARSISSLLRPVASDWFHSPCGQQALALLPRVPLLAERRDVHSGRSTRCRISGALRLWLLWNLFRWTVSSLLSSFGGIGLRLGLLAEDLSPQELKQQGPNNPCHHTHHEGEDHHLEKRDAHDLVRAPRAHCVRDLLWPHLPFCSWRCHG